VSPVGVVGYVAFGVLIAVSMRNFILWVIIPCSSLKVNRCFGGTCLYIHDWGQVKPSVKQVANRAKLNAWNFEWSLPIDVLTAVVMTSGILRPTVRWKSADVTEPCLLPVPLRFLAWHNIRPWRWRQYILPKCQLIFNGLHGFRS
jgi:hypothetical protein